MSKVREKQISPNDYEKAWKGYTNPIAEAPIIKERDKRFRPRKICKLGCCVHEPRTHLDANLVKLCLGLMKNIARLSQKNDKQCKGHLLLMSRTLVGCNLQLFRFCGAEVGTLQFLYSQE